MSASAKPQPKRGKPYHQKPLGGERLATYSLIRAVYFDDLKLAREILAADPDQVNRPDPYAGLTPLHIAIFRQNMKTMKLLCDHPNCNPHQKDNFDRTAVDMLVYTTDEGAFDLVMRRAYPDFRRNPGGETAKIIQLKPRDNDAT